MIWAKRIGVLGALGLGLLTTALGVLPVSAQGTIRGEYGDWQMSCDTPPGASFEQCAIIQNVQAEDQPNVGLSVIMLRTADRQARLLRILAPLGVLLVRDGPDGSLIPGLGLTVDETDLGWVPFVRCLPNGCIAEVVMDDSLVETLSTGETAFFIVFKTPEEGIGIPVSLNGFADGLAALP
ncbi:invasion associated locus B family protein [Devosia chinhatensis]|uniref:invasion associated locus B family protein n=1 Tax=Devosia chinhatensis TaxID=429727 RepID=UPI0009FD28FB|nr:invasion associated locus B family protein [Devosia chinhatensis]